MFLFTYANKKLKWILWTVAHFLYVNQLLNLNLFVLILCLLAGI